MFKRMEEKLKTMVQDEDNFEVWYKDQAAQYSHCDVSEPGHLIYVPVKEGEKVEKHEVTCTGLKDMPRCIEESPLVPRHI